VTTRSGAARLDGALPDDVAVVALGEGAEIDPRLLVALVAERSGGLILCEGGPTLLGDLTRADLLDELFLTIAPQLAGRVDALRRPGLVEGFAATPDDAPTLLLHSLRRAREHLFVRYSRR
jgi:riboflavin biosynthesis pyrimidine reductase